VQTKRAEASEVANPVLSANEKAAILGGVFVGRGL